MTSDNSTPSPIGGDCAKTGVMDIVRAAKTKIKNLFTMFTSKFTTHSKKQFS